MWILIPKTDFFRCDQLIPCGGHHDVSSDEIERILHRLRCASTKKISDLPDMHQKDLEISKKRSDAFFFQ